MGQYIRIDTLASYHLHQRGQHTFLIANLRSKKYKCRFEKRVV